MLEKSVIKDMFPEKTGKSFLQRSIVISAIRDFKNKDVQRAYSIPIGLNLEVHQTKKTKENFDSRDSEPTEKESSSCKQSTGENKDVQSASNSRPIGLNLEVHHTKRRKENFDSKDSELIEKESTSCKQLTGEVKKRRIIKRLCKFCKKSYCNLKRHINDKHNKQGNLDKEDMKIIRREGIMEANREEAKKDLPNYQVERRSKTHEEIQKEIDGFVTCSNCFVTIRRKNFSSHKSKCKKTTINIVSKVAIPENIKAQTYFEDDPLYLSHVMDKFRSDKIGNICLNDEAILYIGQCFFSSLKAKPNKLAEVSSQVRKDMRCLAHLYLIFKNNNGTIIIHNNITDMFERQNFLILKKTIKEYTTDEENKIKPGLKKTLFYLIRKSSENIKCFFYYKGMDEKAKDIEIFISLFVDSKKTIFGDADYNLKYNREFNSLNPNNLPDEIDIDDIGKYCIKNMKHLLENKNFDFEDQHLFVELRNLICARLTIFNGRRGGEVPGVSNMLSTGKFLDNLDKSMSNVKDQLPSVNKCLAPNEKIIKISKKKMKLSTIQRNMENKMMKSNSLQRKMENKMMKLCTKQIKSRMMKMSTIKVIMKKLYQKKN
nr:uncharacterized protein LOC105846917 [Hydra vulgaris]